MMGGLSAAFWLMLLKNISASSCLVLGTGQGVEASVDGMSMAIGNLALMRARGVSFDEARIMAAQTHWDEQGMLL